MQKITFLDALKHTSPHPVSLICVETPTGATNLTAVAWWTYLESEPPMIGFSMAKESYTCELLAKSGKAVLSIPGEAIAEEAWQCGCVSGRDVDKVQKFGISLVEGPNKYPIHSRLAFICRVEQKIIVGDCIFFVCNIDEILLNEKERQLFALIGAEKLTVID